MHRLQPSIVAALVLAFAPFLLAGCSSGTTNPCKLLKTSEVTKEFGKVTKADFAQPKRDVGAVSCAWVLGSTTIKRAVVVTLVRPKTATDPSRRQRSARELLDAAKLSALAKPVTNLGDEAIVLGDHFEVLKGSELLLVELRPSGGLPTMSLDDAQRLARLARKATGRL